MMSRLRAILVHCDPNLFFSYTAAVPASPSWYYSSKLRLVDLLEAPLLRMTSDAVQLVGIKTLTTTQVVGTHGSFDTS